MGAWDSGSVLWLYGLVTTHRALGTLVPALANGGPVLLIGLIGLAVLLPLPGRSSRRWAAVIAGFAVVAGMALAFGLEQVLARPRPFVALGLSPLFAHAANTSFPSDHTLLGVALATPFLKRARWFGLGLLALALLIGLARVAAGVHYPSDVLGGAMLGLGLTMGVDTFASSTAKRLPAPLTRWLQK